MELEWTQRLGLANSKIDLSLLQRQSLHLSGNRWWLSALHTLMRLGLCHCIQYQALQFLVQRPGVKANVNVNW